MKTDNITLGKIAREFGGLSLPLAVLRTEAGFCLGTKTSDGHPFTRESEEYWRTDKDARAALATGDWTQRLAL